MKIAVVLAALVMASPALAGDVTVTFSDQERLAIDAICERALVASEPPMKYRDRLQLSQACAHFAQKLDAAANPAPVEPDKPKAPN